MKRASLAVIAFVLLALPAFAGKKQPVALEQWGQWRGPLGTGVAARGTPPLEWSEERNVRFKVAIPGRGHSTPVVWGERIFLTTAIPQGEPQAAEHGQDHGAHDNLASFSRQKFVVLAVDRRDGKILWQRALREGSPHDSTHQSGSFASGSAVTDGEHLIAFFGSNGLYGLDLEGKLLWEADLGDMRIKHSHGEGSSPALHGDSVIVNWDHEAGSFVVALDKRTGKQRWKVAREEETSWSSPLVVEHAGRAQVIVAATRRVRGYDLETGKVIWECGGLSENVVASPVAADGYVYVTSSYETRALLAIRLDRATGDVTGTDAVAWTRDRDTPYVPSPLLYDGALCFLKHYQGVLTCLDARSGKARFGPERLPGIGNVYASLVGAADRIYVVDLDGTALVLKQGAQLEVLARNRLDDSFAASPAIVGDELILRGAHHLYSIAEPDAKVEKAPVPDRGR